jgi:hypothetical protein
MHLREPGEAERDGVASAFAANSPSFGCAVTMLTEPPIALRPRRVPCGPLFTSTRSMSKNIEPTPRGRGMYTPSMWSATAGSPSSVLLSEPMPRM